MSIEKFITPFIESQFPQFYQEEGPYFIEFVKTYYSWLESQGEILNHSRSLLDYRDLDTTLDNFVIYFKNKYINSLPENIVSDKKLLIKHILDLYRSKGSDNSYSLLFKMLFNEDIELYIPGKNLFSLSDGNWTVPKYIEVTDNPYLKNLIGLKIYSFPGFATATVDNYFTKIVNQKFINVLILNDIKGNFKYGERIFCESHLEITAENAPIIFGSLSSVGITDGGINYNIGDVLNVKNSGVGGLARVISTTSRNGQVEFKLKDGGSGFSLDAIVNVVGQIFDVSAVTNTNPVVVTTVKEHGLSNKDTFRIDYIQGMQEINIPVYGYYANVVNTTAIEVYTDIDLSSSLDGTTFGEYSPGTGFLYINTGGFGANFEIGSIVNREIYRISTDKIFDYYYEKMDSNVAGYGVGITDVIGTFSSGDSISMADVDVRTLDVEIIVSAGITTSSSLANGEILINTSLGISNLVVTNTDETYLQVKGSDITNANLKIGTVLTSDQSDTTLIVRSKFPIETINCTADIIAVTSYELQVNNQVGYLLTGETITDVDSGATAIIGQITRNTNYDFPAVVIPDIENFDTKIGDALTVVDKEVGTIASLKNINSGEMYSGDPIVSIIEPLIYDLKEIGNNGGFKGFNARVDAKAGTANGIVTAVEIIDSGYGYGRDQEISLTTANNQYAVKGFTVVDLSGVSKGYWKDNKSFLSDTVYLQDSYYYQKFSYEIVASRMLDTYEKQIKNLIHPSGMKLFGKFFVKSEFDLQKADIVESSFSQS
jgi:hypothetical protein